VPGLPSATDLAALPHEELAVQLAEAYRVIADQAAVIGQLQERVERLEHRAGKDSSTSSKPPSSGVPYRKKPRDRSLRDKGRRAPGKQPGEPGTTMKLADNPKYRFWYPPAECRECGTGLAGEKVFALRRYQVTDIRPAPQPEVTEHVAQSKKCPCCGEVTAGVLPAHVRPGQFRAGDACAGGEPGLRELRPVLAGRPGRSSGAPAARVIPLACHQAPVPGQERRRGHREHLAPSPPGDQPGQYREPQPVAWLVADPADLADGERAGRRPRRSLSDDPSRAARPGQIQ
jgi:hypothetical protein